MKYLAAIATAAAVAMTSGPAYAAPKKSNDPKPAEKSGNHNDNGRSDQENRQTAQSQGHLHADFDAIANVCGKDNPAASHSALCTPKPASPH